MANDTFYCDTSNEHKDCAIKFQPCEVSKQIDVKVDMSSCDWPQPIPPCPHHHRKHHKKHRNMEIDNCPIPIPLCPISDDDHDKKHHKHHRKHHKKHCNMKIDNCPIPIPLCPISDDDHDKKHHKHNRKHRDNHHKEKNKRCEKSCNKNTLLILLFIVLVKYYNSKFWRN